MIKNKLVDLVINNTNITFEICTNVVYIHIYTCFKISVPIFTNIFKILKGGGHNVKHLQTSPVIRLMFKSRGSIGSRYKTIFRAQRLGCLKCVVFACRRPDVFSGNRLLCVGCCCEFPVGIQYLLVH